MDKLLADPLRRLQSQFDLASQPSFMVIDLTSPAMENTDGESGRVSGHPPPQPDILRCLATLLEHSHSLPCRIIVLTDIHEQITRLFKTKELFRIANTFRLDRFVQDEKYAGAEEGQEDLRSESSDTLSEAPSSLTMLTYQTAPMAEPLDHETEDTARPIWPSSKLRESFSY